MSAYQQMLLMWKKPQHFMNSSKSSICMSLPHTWNVYDNLYNIEGKLSLESFLAQKLRMSQYFHHLPSGLLPQETTLGWALMRSSHI